MSGFRHRLKIDASIFDEYGEFIYSVTQVRRVDS